MGQGNGIVLKISKKKLIQVVDLYMDYSPGMYSDTTAVKLLLIFSI